jgi:hypothetical protein
VLSPETELVANLSVHTISSWLLDNWKVQSISVKGQSKHIANFSDIDNNAPTIIIIQGVSQHDS